MPPMPTDFEAVVLTRPGALALGRPMGPGARALGRRPLCGPRGFHSGTSEHVRHRAQVDAGGPRVKPMMRDMVDHWLTESPDRTGAVYP